MATRFYLDPNNAPDVSPSFIGTYDDTTQAIRRRLDLGTPGNNGSQTPVVSCDTSGTTQNILVCQYVSDPVDSFYSATTAFQSSIRGVESDRNANCYMKCALGHCNGDGSGATFFQNSYSFSEFDYSDLESRYLSITNYTGWTVSQGQRIIFEVSIEFQVTKTNSYDGTLDIRDNSGSDLPASDGDTNAYNPWTQVTPTITLASTDIEIDIFENLTVTENRNIVLNLGNILIWDAVGLSENITVKSILPILIDIFESIGISDIRSEDMPLGEISLAENIWINEILSMEMLLAGIQISESIGIEENVSRILNLAEINLVETIGMSEDRQVVMPLGAISLSEDIGTGETVGESMPLAAITGIENLTVSEILQLLKDLSPTIFESVSVTEFINILSRLGIISLSDSIKLSENLNAALEGISLGAIDLGENLKIQEIIGAALTLIAQKSENVTIVESIAIILDLLKSAIENIKITENIAIELEGLLGTINIVDAIKIIENLQAAINLSEIQGVEDININEFLKTSIEIALSQGENITINEVISILMQLQFSRSDTITIIENLQAAINIGAIPESENIAVNEFLNAALKLLSSISDNIGIYENITTLLEMAASSIQKISLIENIAIELEGLLSTINLQEIIAIIENIQIRMSIGGIFETAEISISEFINAAINLISSAGDDISISESLSILLELMTTAFDRISIIENINIVLEGILGGIIKSELVGISESIQATIEGIGMTIQDSIVIFETIIAMLPMSMTVGDLIKISEFILVNLDQKGLVIDQINLQENISIYFDKILLSQVENISIKEYLRVIVSGIIGKITANFQLSRPGAIFSLSKPGTTFDLSRPNMKFTLN